MGIMNTGSHPKDLWPGVEAHFGHTYNEHPLEYEMIFDTVSSTKAYDERVQYVGMGLAPVKAQGESISFDEAQQGYVSRITNITYALGGIVTREAIEDGQYGDVAMRISGYIAFALRQTPENVAANVLNRAFTGGAYVGGDGVALISNAHPEVGGNQSNYLATPADLSETSIEDLLIQIMNATDSRGLKISLTGMKLITSTSEAFNATRILESSLRPNTANNDINALRNMGMLPDGVVVNHYLTDTDAWFIKTNAREGLIHQSRRAVEFGKDNDFDTENAKMKGSRRDGFGWGDWRGVFGSEGA